MTLEPRNKLTESIVRQVLSSHPERFMRWYLRQFVPGIFAVRSAYRRHESFRLYNTGGTGVSSAGGDGGRKPVWGRIANAKIFGWLFTRQALRFGFLAT